MITRHPFGVRHGISGLSPAVVAIFEALCGIAAPAPATPRPPAAEENVTMLMRTETARDGSATSSAG